MSLLVTGLNEQLDVGVHERGGHRNVRSIRHDGVLVRPLGLDTANQGCSYPQTQDLQAEDVVPSTAVQSRRVLPQLVQELFHLERGRERLNETSGPDAVLRQTQLAGSQVEDIIPKSSFKVVLHLGKVEVWAVTALDQFGGVVEKVDGEIEKTSGDSLSVNKDVTFIKVPSSWSGDELRFGKSRRDILAR